MSIYTDNGSRVWLLNNYFSIYAIKTGHLGCKESYIWNGVQTRPG